jgi:signal transduction histidine kinase
MAHRSDRRPHAVALGALAIGAVTAVAIGLEAARPRTMLETTFSVSAIVIAGLLVLVLTHRSSTKARKAQAYAALGAERERIARDLHDGLAQDLVYITSQGQRLGLELGADHPVMVAARRALAGVRGAIADLTASEAPSAEAALRTIASELGRRFGLQVDVVVHAEGRSAASDDAAREEREHLVRIAREAIVNAALHGSARHVEVLFERRGGNVRMRISDDGCGVADVDRVGFGLRTMHARARSLGGELGMRPGPDGGTVLELLVRGGRVSRAAKRARDRNSPIVPSLAGSTRAPGRGPAHSRLPLAGGRKQFQRHGV